MFFIMIIDYMGCSIW